MSKLDGAFAQAVGVCLCHEFDALWYLRYYVGECRNHYYLASGSVYSLCRFAYYDGCSLPCVEGHLRHFDRRQDLVVLAVSVDCASQLALDVHAVGNGECHLRVV